MAQLAAVSPAMAEGLVVEPAAQAPDERLPVPLAAVMISLLSMACWGTVVGVAALLL